MFKILKFWIFEKSLKFWAAKYKNASNLPILQKAACIESFFLFAVTLFFAEKILQSAALFWSRLQVVWILQIFYSRAVLQKKAVYFPVLFWGPVRWKRGRFAHIWPDPFLSGSELWTPIKNSSLNFKKLKNMAVDVLSRACPMVLLSGWSNLAGRLK